MRIVRLKPKPLYSMGKTPGTQWRGGWVGARVGLDAVASAKNGTPIPRLSRWQPRRYIGCHLLVAGVTAVRSESLQNIPAVVDFLAITRYDKPGLRRFLGGGAVEIQRPQTCAIPTYKISPYNLLTIRTRKASHA
jgi:hypothetical protein